MRVAHDVVAHERNENDPTDGGAGVVQRVVGNHCAWAHDDAHIRARYCRAEWKIVCCEHDLDIRPEIVCAPVQRVEVAGDNAECGERDDRSGKPCGDRSW
jgi:hypothetical protein